MQYVLGKPEENGTRFARFYTTNKDEAKSLADELSTLKNIKSGVRGVNQHKVMVYAATSNAKSLTEVLKVASKYIKSNEVVENVEVPAPPVKKLSPAPVVKSEEYQLAEALYLLYTALPEESQSYFKKLLDS